MKRARQQAVESVAETGNHENSERPEISPFDQMDHNERNENHSQQGQLVGRGEDLGKLHAGSFEAGDEETASDNTADGSSPVLAKKRCEREGRLPSGRSSSTRSMRCMGKNTTAGVKGSPSRTITARSSKEASSAPLRLRPSAARARIIPQNFSRGLHKVAITSAPGTNGSRVLAAALGAPIAESFCTLRLSPGEACIANAGALERKSASTFDSELRYAWRTWNQRLPLRLSNSVMSPTA